MKPSTNSKVNMPIIKKASGRYCWDIDGNKYLDFTASNLTTVLGYRPRQSVVPNMPGVSSAEGEFKQLLSQYTNTDHFKFYPSGSDAVNNAIRLARHILGNDNASVFFVGYAGSNDAYARTINDNGIPKQYSSQIDSPIMEIIDCDIVVFESRHEWKTKNINAKIRIADHLKSGIVGLYENISADLHSYGKSIFNGSSGAILTGRPDYMERIDEVYYSTTFGCNNDMMIEGIRTIKDFEKLKDKYFELYNYAREVLPEWFSATPEQIKEFQKHGVLFNGYCGVMASHTKKDIKKLALLCDKLL